MSERLFDQMDHKEPYETFRRRKVAEFIGRGVTSLTKFEIAKTSAELMLYAHAHPQLKRAGAVALLGERLQAADDYPHQALFLDALATADSNPTAHNQVIVSAGLGNQGHIYLLGVLTPDQAWQRPPYGIATPVGLRVANNPYWVEALEPELMQIANTANGVIHAIDQRFELMSPRAIPPRQ